MFYDIPWNYFTHALKLAQDVRQISPDASLVFVVSAIEVLLQKIFVFSHPFHQYLVDQRAVSFQQLRTARAIFQQRYGFDLAQIAGSSTWSRLMEAVRIRHQIIHNASHDKLHRPLKISKPEVDVMHALVESFARAVDERSRRLLLY